MSKPLILKVSNVPDELIKREGKEFKYEECGKMFEDEKKMILEQLGVNIIAIAYNDTMYSYVKIMDDDRILYFMPLRIILRCNPKKYKIGGKHFHLVRW